MPNIVRVGAGDDGIVDAPCVDTGDDSGTLFVCDPLLAGTEPLADASITLGFFLVIALW